MDRARQHRIALDTALRVVAGLLALGYFQLLTQGLRLLIVWLADPGGPGPLTRPFGLETGGSTWAMLFLAITLLEVALAAGAVVWILRLPAPGETSPWILLALGLGGLFSSALAYGAGILNSILLGQRGAEALAAMSIAGNAANLARMLLLGLLALATIIYLTVMTLRTREGS